MRYPGYDSSQCRYLCEPPCDRSCTTCAAQHAILPNIALEDDFLTWCRTARGSHTFGLPDLIVALEDAFGPIAIDTFVLLHFSVPHDDEHPVFRSDIGFNVDFGQYIVQATFTSFTLNLAE